MAEEIVLSVRRPLCVQRSTELQEAEGNPRRQEYYSEEIEHHAHVTMETPPTFFDAINNMNMRVFFYFAFLITASMFVSLGAEVPLFWLISGLILMSLGLFIGLKL